VVQGEQAHDEAGRAEAALGAVLVDQGLLHRVQPLFARQAGREVLDRNELLAVQGGQ